MNRPWFLFVVGCLMQLCFLAFFLGETQAASVAIFILVHAVVYCLLAFVFFRLGGNRALPQTASGNGRLSLGVILGFAVLFRVSLLGVEPVASDDIYRYVWDGKAASHGFNPFEFAPADPVLSDLHSEVLPGRINFPGMRTIYPPLAQAFFWVSYQLFPDSVPGMKLLLTIADILSMLLLIRILHVTGSAKERVVLYAWSPVPVLYLSLDGHIDGLGVPLLLVCLLMALTQKPIRSSLGLAAASLAKLYPLFLLPFLARLWSGRLRFIYPIIVVGLAAIGYAFYLEPTGGVFESFLVYNTTFEFNGAVYPILEYLIGSNVSAHVMAGLLFCLWLIILFFLKRPLVESVLLAFVGFLILSPTAHPWYFLWPAALLVLRWSLSVFVLIGLTNLSNIVVYNYRTTGIWEDHPFVLLAEYLPFFILLIWEISRKQLLLGPPKAGV